MLVTTVTIVFSCFHIFNDKFSPGEQPIFTCKAHVFHIDPKTKRSWISASSSAVAVSFFYDSSRSLYRISTVEGTKAVINSITPTMTFTKTSQKFGQLSNVRANTVYGLGFGSEGELNKFIEKFVKEVKEATVRAGSTGKPSNGGATPTASANASPVTGRCSDKHNDNIPDHFPSNQNDAVNSNLLKNQLSIGSDSPKKNQDNGPAPNPPLSGEAKLKYENDRLKLALAQSSANAKQWEIELSTLKNNNARLTSALQDSINRQFGDYLHHLGQLQNELTQVLNT